MAGLKTVETATCNSSNKTTCFPPLPLPALVFLYINSILTEQCISMGKKTYLKKFTVYVMHVSSQILLF